MELVETAQDSAGRSEELFAKYLDTVEYKLNQLKNSWEQLRVSFLDSDVFKGAIDKLNEFVGALQKIDFKKLLVMSPIIVTVAKNFVMTFINTLQNSANTFRKAGQTLVDKLTETWGPRIKKKYTDVINGTLGRINSRFLIPLDIDVLDALKRYNIAKTKLEQFMAQHPLAYLLTMSTGMTGEELANMEADKFLELSRKLGLTTEELKNTINELNASEGRYGNTILATNLRMLESERIIVKQQSALLGARLGFSMVSSAAAMFVTTLISTKDAEASFKALLGSLIAMSTQMALLYAMMKVEARIAGESIGLELEAGLAATGVGLTIVAISTAIAAIGLALTYTYKKAKEANKSLDELLADAQEKLKKVEENLNSAKESARSSKETYENTKKLKEEYEELSNKTIKTTEEQEKYNELVEQIRDLFPEIVLYYNEMTGLLEILNELWDSIIEKLSLLNKQASIDKLFAGYQYAQLDRDVLELLLAKELADWQVSTLKINNEKIKYTDLTEWANSFTDENIGNDRLAKKYGKLPGNNYDDFIEYAKPLAKLLGLDLNNKWEQEDLIKVLSAQYTGDTSDLDSRTRQLYSTLVEIQKTSETKIGKIELQISKLEEVENAQKVGYAREYITNLFGETPLSDVIALDVVENIKNVPTFNDPNKYYQEYSMYIDDYRITGDNSDEKEKSFSELGDNVKRDILLTAYQTQLTQQKIDDISEKVSEEQLKEVNDFLEEIQNSTYKDIQNSKFLTELPTVLEPYFDLFKENLIKNLDENIENISTYSKSLSIKIDDFTGNLIDILSNSLLKVVDDYGTDAALGYADILSNMISDYNLSGLDLSLILTEFDFSKVTPANWDEFKEGLITNLQEAGIEGADKLVEEIAPKLKDLGILNLTISNIEDLDEFKAKYSELLEKTYKEKDTFISVLTKQITEGKIALEDYLKLQKSLEEIGEDITDYTTVDANGNMVANLEKLKSLYLDNVSAISTLLEILLEQEKEQLELLKLERDRYVTEKAITSEEYQQQIYNLMNNANMSEQKAREYLKNNLVIDQAEIDTLDTRILALQDAIEETEKYLNEVQNKTKAYTQDFNNSLAKSLEDNAKKAEDALKKVQDALEKVKEAEEKVQEATEKLNETLYGTADHKNKLDFLYNYQINLDRIVKKANDAKDALEDLKGESATAQLDEYLSGVHAEAVTRRAENQVIQKSIDNYQSILDNKLAERIAQINAQDSSRNLSTNISDYYTRVGDRLNVNFQALNAAQLPDDLSDYVEETIEQINKLSDEIEKNNDELTKKEKEFNNMKRKARQDYLKIEDTVVSTLKEKYDEEIKATEDKYKAIEEADNDYLDALSKAIDKQRKLRDKENKWNTLQEKQRKLSLLQRDTSGTNTKNVLLLLKDVEKDLQDMLDNAVDEMIDSLKEMYELLKETREAELEYQKAMIDNANLVQEANAIIEGWNSADDAVAWFYENTKDLSEMSIARLEEETESWRELYDTKTTYMAVSLADFESALSTTAEEILSVVSVTSETLTLEADRSLNEIVNKVLESIDSVERALQDAILALYDARVAYSLAVLDAAQVSGGLYYGDNNLNNLNSNTNSEPVQGMREIPNKRVEIRANGLTYNIGIGELKNLANYNGDGFLIKLGIYQGKAVLGTRDIYQLLEDNEESAIRQLSMLLYGVPIHSAADIRNEYPILQDNNNNKRHRLNAFATGGLVNYTGPAWVDGTPNKPEAFLSAEDTLRIGNAAKLLANLPILNSKLSNESFTTTNIGGTSIEVHLNVENISSDYDVDQMIERVKTDIVNSSRSIGNQVIIKR